MSNQIWQAHPEAPIWQAYDATGALDIPCPTCGAAPKVWCTKPDGRVRRAPCVRRAAAANYETPFRSSSGTARDFSEPTKGDQS
jgi:hypothetical protein